MFGLRVVVTHHGCDYDRAKWGPVAKTILRLGERLGLKFSHGRIAVSRSLAVAMEQRYRIAVTPVPNAVALPTVPQSIETIRAFGLEQGRYILTVGRFVPEKRQTDLIAAFRGAAIPGWKLVIVGDADHADAYSEDLKAQARKTPDVVLTGVQTGPALAELFGHAGAFVLASSHEGLPIALLEALAYGLPCIASDILPHRELELGASRYFAAGDVDQLSQRLTKVASELFTASERSAQRARIAAEHDCNRFARLTLGVYLDALGQRKTATARKAAPVRRAPRNAP
jgi:glycosyltransferase involved in cell wall biosynthesis